MEKNDASCKEVALEIYLTQKREEMIGMLQSVLEDALRAGREQIGQGHCATYIPELGHTDPRHLGAAVVLSNGTCVSAGDADTRFTIQSISKVINLAVALQKFGFDYVFQSMNMEPSGDAFNSLIKLDLTCDKPFNPMINAGAITTMGYLADNTDFETMLDYTRKVCLDREIAVNEQVYASEMGHCARNRAIAYLLQSKDVLRSDVDRTIELYTKMCSLNVTAKSLAGFGAVLALGGRDPLSGERLMDGDVVRVIKTIMFTCGMYDGAGEFAVRVGIPAKSGVGGGILAVGEGRMGIGIYGPALDQKGNSVAGQRVLEYLAAKLSLHIFAGK